MTRKELRQRLRSPRGQLTLLGVTLLVAAVIALVVALQRPFFESYVREEYPEPAGKAVEVAESVERGQAGVAEVLGLSAAERDGLYFLWMRREQVQVGSPLPRTLTEADPERACRLVERTLVAGSHEQRVRAIAFARAARSIALLPVLRWGLQRAERMRDPRVAALLTEAVDQTASSR